MIQRMNRIIVSFVVLLVFTITVFAPAAHAAYQPTPYVNNYSVVAKPGDNNDTVKEIKNMLKCLGYMSFSGNPSGSYDIMTKYAVFYFQLKNRLSVTGTVDQSTYEAMKYQYQAKGGQCPVTQPVPAPAPAPQPAPQPQPQPQPQPAPAPQPAPTPAPVSGLTADEQKMVDLINQERAKAGVAPLKVDMKLVQSARAKSQDMIDNNYFSHTSPVYGSFSALIRKYAPNYSYIGENLAGNRTVEAAHSALMNSQGHRQNILNPKYTHFGIGIIDGGPYGKMFTQHFGG